MGSAYGIANRTGRPDVGAVVAILGMAKDAGICMLDTAAAYGESEKILGLAGVSHWQIITKIPALNEIPYAQIEATIRESVFRSIDRLRCDRLYAVMMHSASDLTGSNAVVVSEALETLNSEGICARTGLSLYRPEELQGLPPKYSPGILQAPLNLLDQRILTSETAQNLSDNGCEVHARSLFLQGLLLMPPETRPAYFTRWSKAISACDLALGDDPLAGCLGFAAASPGIARLVVGVESETQLREVIEAAKRARYTDGATNLACYDTNLLEPRFWRRS